MTPVVKAPFGRFTTGRDEVIKSPSPFNMSENKPKILIIEDDRYLRELIIKKLEKEKFEILETADGKEGLKKTKEEKPDLILLDLVLPGIDGYAVLSQIKADPEMSSIPVIIISNLGQIQEIQRGLKLGAVDYLIKAHFTPETIIEKVRRHLK